MNGALLSQPIDPPDALFETNRRPWQIQVDDESTSLMKVQPLAGRVRGEQHHGVPLREPLGSVSPLGWRHAAVEEHTIEIAQRSCDTGERVAVLGEDDRRLSGRHQEPPQPA
jgi:hypothetical protein